MKKLVIVMMLFLLIQIPSFASESVVVEIPDYDVSVNGEVIDTKHSEYPVLKYKNITYFPMTSDYLSGLGLSFRFSSSTGFNISKGSSVGTFSQKFLGANNVLGSKYTATLVSSELEINGNRLNNKNEVYPVLMYKNIAYFPMTWRFAVTEFGWKTKWSNETGFAITVSKGSERKAVVATQSTEAIKNISSTFKIDDRTISYTAYKVDLDDENIELKTALAGDTIGTAASLESIAEDHGALLAINGSYFSAYDETLPKDPYGILVVEGKVVHNMNDRATFGIKDGQIDIDRVDASIRGENTYAGKTYPWIGWWLNHTTYENGTNMTVFDDTRGSETLAYFGTNYVVKDDQVINIVKDQSVKIPKGGYVININGTVGATPEQVYDRFDIGYTVDFNVKLTPENSNSQSFWTDLDYATGAGPALILDGQIDIDYEAEHFTEKKIYEASAARSAIGYTEEHELILVTTTSTMDELAELMLSLGCYEAMNLDGGASSGLWYDGSYSRTPGRDISNIIYITTK